MILMKQPKSMFVKMLFSITIVLVISILISVFTLYRYFEKEQLNTVINASSKILGQMSYSAEYMSNSARNFSFSVFNNNEFFPLMYQDQDSDSMKFLTPLNKLRSLIEMNPFVHSVYIYNNKLDTYYTAMLMNAYKSSDFPDSEIVSMINNHSEFNGEFKPVPRKIAGQVGAPEANVYTYMLGDLSSRDNTVMGAVVVNVKSDYLQNMIEKLRFQNSIFDGDVFIVDNNGNMISNENRSLFLSNVSKLSYIEKIMNETRPSGSFFDEKSGQMVFFVSSEVLGWKFVKTVPYEAIVAHIDEMKVFTIWLCIGLLAIALLVSVLLSRRLYLPLYQLVEKVKGQTGADDSKKMKGDEISILSFAFHQSQLKAIRLEQAELEKLSEQKRDFLKQILTNDGMNSDELQRSLSGKFKLQVDLRQSYIVVLLSIDRFLEFRAKHTAKDRELFRYSLINAVHEVMLGEFANEVFEVDEDKIVIIANVMGYDKYEAIKNVLEVNIHKIRTWSDENLRIKFTTAYGYVCDDFARLKDSYEEVRNISNYRLIFGTGATLTPETIKYQNFEKYILPVTLEKQLSEAIVNGNAEAAGKCLAAFIEEVSTYSYDTVISSFFYLNYSIYNTMNVIEGNSIYKFHVDFNDFAEKVAKQETITDIHRLYSQLFAQIFEVVNESKSKRPSKLIDMIKNLIESNYKDKSLCLESVASTLNMSKIYLGKIFREYCGLSVADYIMNIRIQKAVELLHENVKPMSEIIEEIGIENMHYFYKVFKAKVGTSFSEYKLKCLNEKISSESESK